MRLNLAFICFWTLLVNLFAWRAVICVCVGQQKFHGPLCYVQSLRPVWHSGHTSYISFFWYMVFYWGDLHMGFIVFENWFCLLCSQSQFKHRLLISIMVAYNVEVVKLVPWCWSFGVVFYVIVNELPHQISVNWLWLLYLVSLIPFFILAVAYLCRTIPLLSALFSII